MQQIKLIKNYYAEYVKNSYKLIFKKTVEYEKKT